MPLSCYAFERPCLALSGYALLKDTALAVSQKTSKGKRLQPLRYAFAFVLASSRSDDPEGAGAFRPLNHATKKGL